MSPMSRLAVTLATTLLAACAGGPQAVRPGAAKTGADDAAAALYARLDRDSQRYADGLTAARAGETDKAQAEMKAALDDLRAAATACAEQAGCDQQRFVAGFDALLRQGIGDGVTDEASQKVTEIADAERSESPAIKQMPQLGRTVTLLKGRELSEVIAMNEPVKAALEEWLTQYRPFLMAAWDNYQYMRAQMWPEYQKAGLPEALLFGMLAKESGGRVHAVSRSGASGPLQFMYATGLRFGLSSVDGFDQRFDPKLSARANAAYVNEQLAIFNNNLELVIGAYNGGEGAMARRAGRGADALSFWNPQIYFGVSQETREYVPSVLAAAWLFLHPERYNLQFPKLAAGEGRITLARPASLAELTICLGQRDEAHGGWFRTLRNLNPQLDPQQREPAGATLRVPVPLEAVYTRNCTDGRWPTLAQELHAAVVPSPPPVALGRGGAAPVAKSKDKSVTVRKGDTLTAISGRTGCSVKQIASANGLRHPRYAIRPGQVLKLSGCAAR